MATPDPVRDTVSRNQEESREGRHSINSGISTCIFTQVHVHLYAHKWHIHICTHITFIQAIVIKVIFKGSKKAEMSILNSRSITQRKTKTFFTFSYRIIYCLLFNPQECIYFPILQMMKQKSRKYKKPAQIAQLERDDVRVWSMYIVACAMSPSDTALIFLQCLKHQRQPSQVNLSEWDESHCFLKDTGEPALVAKTCNLHSIWEVEEVRSQGWHLPKLHGELKASLNLAD